MGDLATAGRPRLDIEGDIISAIVEADIPLDVKRLDEAVESAKRRTIYDRVSGEDGMESLQSIKYGNATAYWYDGQEILDALGSKQEQMKSPQEISDVVEAPEEVVKDFLESFDEEGEVNSESVGPANYYWVPDTNLSPGEPQYDNEISFGTGVIGSAVVAGSHLTNIISPIPAEAAVILLVAIWSGQLLKAGRRAVMAWDSMMVKSGLERDF